MPDINLSSRKIFGQNLRHAIRRGPVIDHFRFRPDTRVLYAGIVTPGRGHTVGVLFATAGYMNVIIDMDSDCRTMTAADVFVRFAVPTFRNRFLQQLVKLVLEIRKLDSVLRPFWPGNTWLN